MANTLIKSLQHLLKCCNDIKHLLTQDIASFRKNDLATINQSHEQKQIILNELATLMQSMQQPIPGSQPKSFFERIYDEASHLVEQEKLAVHKLLIEFKTELQDCYEKLAINHHIVNSNLDYLKMVWDNLLLAKHEANCTYDAKGQKK